MKKEVNISLMVVLVTTMLMLANCGGPKTTTQPQTLPTSTEPAPQSSTVSSPTTSTQQNTILVTTSTPPMTETITPTTSTVVPPTTTEVTPSSWNVTIEQVEVVHSLDMWLGYPLNQTTHYNLSQANRAFLTVGFSLSPNTEQNYFDFKDVKLINNASESLYPVGLHTGASGSNWIVGTSGACKIEIISKKEAKLECDLEFSKANDFGIENDSLTGNSNSFSSTLSVTGGPLFTFAFVVPFENGEVGDYWLQLPASQPVELEVTDMGTTTTVPATTSTSTIPAPTTTTQSPPPTTTTPPPVIQASDGNVSIAVEEPTRADTLPDNIVETLQETNPQFESPSPSAGSDFVCIYLTIVDIEGILVTNALGFENEKSILITEDNQEYEPFLSSIKGVIFQDPHDIRSPYEYVEGATGFLVFEVPKTKTLSEINFIYTFKETWEGQSAKGQIDVAFGSQNDTAVEFPDANLESAIRGAINKPAGEILESDLASITTLTASESGIVNISGLEHCVNLEYLDLFGNSIRDILPLAELTNLQTLYLYQNSNLTDISPLAKLSNLEVLKLGQNNLSDISHLSGLTKLQVLYLPGNNIEDVSPLTGLGNLALLVLINNNISDISSLVESSGLSSGDIIDLRGNPLNNQSIEIHIPQLRSKGVDVRF